VLKYLKIVISVLLYESIVSAMLSGYVSIFWIAPQLGFLWICYLAQHLSAQHRNYYQELLWSIITITTLGFIHDSMTPQAPIFYSIAYLCAFLILRFLMRYFSQMTKPIQILLIFIASLSVHVLSLLVKSVLAGAFISISHMVPTLLLQSFLQAIIFILISPILSTIENTSSDVKNQLHQ